MKKIISSAVLLTVLVGAVTMIVGCGEKPTKESVWDRSPYVKDNGEVTELAFHSNGYVYVTIIEDKTQDPVKIKTKEFGKYSMKYVEVTKDKKTTTAPRIIISDGNTGNKIAMLTYAESKGTLLIKEADFYTATVYKFLGTYKKNPSASAEDIKKKSTP